MKRVKKIVPGGFYLFESRSTANSCYFERKRECKLFYNIFDNKLGSIVTVYDYLLVNDGWVMVLKVGEIEKLEAYWTMRYPEKPIPAPWEIVSEFVRQALSQYVIRVNEMRRCSGTLVHSSYERYYFQTKHEAMATLESIRNGELRSKQKRKRYRARPKRYYRLIKLGKGSAILCSGGVRRRSVECGINRVMKCISHGDLTSVVLLNLVKFTEIEHIRDFSPP